MDIKVGDVFKFRGTDEGVFYMLDADVPSVRMRVVGEIVPGLFSLQVVACSDKGWDCTGLPQVAHSERIAEVLEKVVA